MHTHTLNLFIAYLRLCFPFATYGRTQECDNLMPHSNIMSVTGVVFLSIQLN